MPKIRLSSHDFGKDVIPKVIEDHHVYAYPFKDIETDKPYYWRDVGTVDSYWKANMELVGVTPELNIYDSDWPIRTRLRQYPPAKFIFNDDGREEWRWIPWSRKAALYQVRTLKNHYYLPMCVSKNIQPSGNPLFYLMSL